MCLMKVNGCYWYTDNTKLIKTRAITLKQFASILNRKYGSRTFYKIAQNPKIKELLVRV